MTPGRMHLFGYDIAQLTMTQMLADKAKKHGDRNFLTYLPDGRSYSYADIDLLSNQLANSLMQVGIRKGTHVALVMENCPEQLLAYFALAKIGAVAVLLNVSMRGQLLAYFLTNSDAGAVILESQFLDRINDIEPDIPNIRQLVVLSDEAQAPLPTKSLTAPWTVTDFRTLFEGSSKPPEVEVKFSDLAMLAYTSGTTGPSKGNMYVQATTLLWAMATAENHGYRSSDTIYICLPQNHAGSGLLSQCYGALVADGAVALTRRFSVSHFWEDIRRSKATFTTLVGAMANMLWSLPASPLDIENSLWGCMMVPMPPFALEFEKRYGLRLITAWGLTDYAVLTNLGIGSPISKLRSVGRPRPGVELRVVDENDLDVASGEVGELVARSNNPWATSQGYYKMPEATVKAMRNLWFHTGDSGYVDQDGYFYFADRLKDSIRRRGENISSFEVENVMRHHPAVADVAVYPVRSELAEDEVAASVLLREGVDLSAVDLVHYCIANMAHYMVPRFIEFVTEFPRTPSQKIEKYKLRGRTEENLDSLWDRDKAGIKVHR